MSVSSSTKRNINVIGVQYLSLYHSKAALHLQKQNKKISRQPTLSLRYTFLGLFQIPLTCFPVIWFWMATYIQFSFLVNSHTLAAKYEPVPCNSPPLWERVYEGTHVSNAKDRIRLMQHQPARKCESALRYKQRRSCISTVESKPTRSIFKATWFQWDRFKSFAPLPSFLIEFKGIKELTFGCTVL